MNPSDQIQQIKGQNESKIAIRAFIDCFPEASPNFSERLTRLDKAQGDYNSSGLSQTELLLVNFTASLLDHSYGEQFRTLIGNCFRNLSFNPLSQCIVPSSRQVLPNDFGQFLNPTDVGEVGAHPQPTETTLTPQVEFFQLDVSKKGKKKKKVSNTQPDDQVKIVQSSMQSLKRNISTVRQAIYNKQYVDLSTYLPEMFRLLDTIAKHQNILNTASDAQSIRNGNVLRSEEGQQWINDYNLLCKLHQANAELKRTSLQRKGIERLLPTQALEVDKVFEIQARLSQDLETLGQDFSISVINAPLTEVELGRLVALEEHYEGYFGNINSTPLNILLMYDILNRSGIEHVLQQNFPKTFANLQENLKLIAQIAITIDNAPFAIASNYANSLLSASYDLPMTFGGSFTGYSSSLEESSENFTLQNYLTTDQIKTALTKLVHQQLDESERALLDATLMHYTHENKLEYIYAIGVEIGVSNKVVRDLINMASYIKPYSSILPSRDSSVIQQGELNLRANEKDYFRKFNFPELVALVKSVEDNNQMAQLKRHVLKDMPAYTDSVIGCLLNMVDKELSEENQLNAANFLITFKQASMV